MALLTVAGLVAVLTIYLQVALLALAARRYKPSHHLPYPAWPRPAEQRYLPWPYLPWRYFLW